MLQRLSRQIPGIQGFAFAEMIPCIMLPCSAYGWNHGKSPIYLYNVLSSEVFRLFIWMPTFWVALFSVHVELRIAVSRAHWFGRDFVSWSQNQVQFMFYNSTMSEEFLMWMPSDHTAKNVSLLRHWWDKAFFSWCALIYNAIKTSFPATEISGSEIWLLSIAIMNHMNTFFLLFVYYKHVLMCLNTMLLHLNYKKYWNHLFQASLFLLESN